MDAGLGMWTMLWARGRCRGRRDIGFKVYISLIRVEEVLIVIVFSILTIKMPLCTLILRHSRITKKPGG